EVSNDMGGGSVASKHHVSTLRPGEVDGGAWQVPIVAEYFSDLCLVNYRLLFTPLPRPYYNYTFKIMTLEWKTVDLQLGKMKRDGYGDEGGPMQKRQRNTDDEVTFLIPSKKSSNELLQRLSNQLELWKMNTQLFNSVVAEKQSINNQSPKQEDFVSNLQLACCGRLDHREGRRKYFEAKESGQYLQ
ncbi:hypothetical protein HF086_006141, partial [Spodoptera exigua]